MPQIERSATAENVRLGYWGETVMKINSARITKFKRFENLTIGNIPPSAQVVILAGPNGSGKTSLFDAFRQWHAAHGGFSGGWDQTYYDRPGAIGAHDR